MKFKIKINETTDFEYIKKELNKVKNSNVKEIPLNYIRRITMFLGIEEIQGTGSSIRFYHKSLESDRYFNGYFQIHKIHKGGNKEEIRKSDFVRYLYPVLLKIIENIENE